MNRTGAAVVASLACGLLAGCGSATTPGSSATAAPVVVIAYRAGLPSGGASSGMSSAPYLAWGDVGHLQVVTFGSSGCPRLPTSVVTGPGNSVTVTTIQHGGPVCTMDIVPTTSTVAIPTGLDHTSKVAVNIDGNFSSLGPR